MAFGKFFKDMFERAKQGIKKIIPAFRKGAEIVQQITPIASKIGGLVGGKAGEWIQKGAETTDHIVKKVTPVIDQIQSYATGGGGADRFLKPKFNS